MCFEKGYFINSSVSNYMNYTKKKFSALSEDLIKFVPIRPNNSVLDFGCATGGLIFELKKGGITNIKGTDISYWAIRYGKESFGLEKELDYFNVNLLNCSFDIVLFLDVLEHIPSITELRNILGLVKSPVIVVRLPVSLEEGQNYHLKVSRNDQTHVQCHSKAWWETLFSSFGFFLSLVFYGKSIYDSKGVLARIYKKEE